MLTAVLTLLSAYLGLQTAALAQDRNQAQSSADQKDTSLTDLEQQVSALKADNDRLKAQIDQLGPTAGGTPDSTAGPSASPTPSAPGTIRRAGQVTVSASGNALDLDAPRSDPQWSRAGRDTDLGYSAGEDFTFAYYAQFLSLGSTPATFEVCRDSTGYSNGYSAHLEVGTVTAGDYLCIRTDEQRIAAVRILSFDDSGAKFDITVFDPPQK